MVNAFINPGGFMSLTCNECLVSIESGMFCKLCAPSMEEPAMEVAMSIQVKPEVSMVDKTNEWAGVREPLPHKDLVEYIRMWRMISNDIRDRRRALAKKPVVIDLPSVTKFTVFGKGFELAKFTKRNLLKLLRSEGYLPAESSGKTKVEQAGDLTVTVSYKDIVFVVELDGVTAEESFGVGSNFQDMADHIRLHGKEVMTADGYETVLESGTDREVCFAYDKNGHELGVSAELNKPIRNVYAPSELSEFEADIDAGCWLSPAALMIHASELDSVFVPDYNDSYIELTHYYTNFLTRKNSISEEDAMENLIESLARLNAVTTLEELNALGKELWSKQNKNAATKMYYYPKSGSKAVWDLYGELQINFGGELMKNYFNRLAAVTTLTDLHALKDEVLKVANCPQKADFWAKYHDKSELIKSTVTDSDKLALSVLLDKLSKVSDVTALAKLREEVISTPNFPGKAGFWSNYYTKRDELNAKRDELTCKKFVEICLLITEYSSPAMLYKVRQELINTYFPVEVKKALHSKIDSKLDEGIVSIDINAGLVFLKAQMLEEQAKRKEKYASRA
jgi:hypothetical protein